MKPYDKVLKAIDAGRVAAGTAWMWARAEFADAVDVLFVDEAGQMSLASTLAAAQGARAMVLLGDPQQLEQPQQASHPDGAGVSALTHFLGGAKTMPADRGLFLATTWRLHPAICAYTSELFYEGRLAARDACALQRIDGPTPFAGAGLYFVPVAHEGNQARSDEEAGTIARLAAALVAPGVTWTDADGRTAPLTRDDVLVIAPYNAQVAALQRHRGLAGIEIGTVDRFQGREAAAVIYAMTSSSAADAPRGLEFLYDLHRVNVATSRARAAAIWVGSPRLFEPDCASPRQMRLANAFCRFREIAATVDPGAF
jgi:uncharacterized protein